MNLPVLTVASDDSQLVCPGHGQVGVPDHHDRIQTLRQGELNGHKNRTVVSCSHILKLQRTKGKKTHIHDLE